MPPGDTDKSGDIFHCTTWGGRGGEDGGATGRSQGYCKTMHGPRNATTAVDEELALENEPAQLRRARPVPVTAAGRPPSETHLFSISPVPLSLPDLGEVSRPVRGRVGVIRDKSDFLNKRVLKANARRY